MNPFKHISDTQKVVKDLTYNLKFSNNKTKDIKNINTIIDCVNSFESMLENKYKVSEIDNLLAYIFTDFVSRVLVDGKGKEDLDLHYIINKLELHWKHSSDENICLLARDILQNEFYKDILNGNYEKAAKVAKTPNKNIESLIKNLFLQFKTYMKWRKLK